MSTEAITNFIKINEKIGTAGQPTEEQLQSARDEGYTNIINLAPESADNYALPNESGVVAALGMQYLNIPVEWGNPKETDFDKFTEAMDQLREKKVLIHCAANFRVTAFYSLYAMKREGWSAEEADKLIAKIWESRADYRMDDTWKTFIGAIRSRL